MGDFDSYLANLSAPAAPVQNNSNAMAKTNRFSARGSAFGGAYDSSFMGGGAPPPGAGGGSSFPAGADWIRQGFEPAFGYIKGGSEAAGSLLRQAYEGQFRARAAGYAGSMSEAQRGYGAQIAGQNLSPDVAARQLLEQRMGGLQGLAQARGEGQYGLDTDLAKLAKGTGTEFAGLTRDQLAQVVNYLTASKAASATESAGGMSAIATLLGGVIGGL